MKNWFFCSCFIILSSLHGSEKDCWWVTLPINKLNDNSRIKTTEQIDLSQLVDCIAKKPLKDLFLQAKEKKTPFILTKYTYLSNKRMEHIYTIKDIDIDLISQYGDVLERISYECKYIDGELLINVASLK